jgi:hypothetical protein
MIQIIQIVSILLVITCNTKTSNDYNNKLLLAGILLNNQSRSSSSVVIPAVEDCAVTTTQGGTTNRKVFTAVSLSQEIYTTSSSTDQSTTVYVKVNAMAGSKLLVRNFDLIGTSSRVITPYSVSSCPFNTSDTTISVNSSSFSDSATSGSNPRTIQFNVAGTYYLQFYTGSGTIAPGAPAPLSSTAARPTIQLQ